MFGCSMMRWTKFASEVFWADKACCLLSYSFILARKGVWLECRANRYTHQCSLFSIRIHVSSLNLGYGLIPQKLGTRRFVARVVFMKTKGREINIAEGVASYLAQRWRIPKELSLYFPSP